MDKDITSEMIEELLYKPQGVLQSEEMCLIGYEAVVRSVPNSWSFAGTPVYLREHRFAKYSITPAKMSNRAP